MAKKDKIQLSITAVLFVVFMALLFDLITKKKDEIQIAAPLTAADLTQQKTAMGSDLYAQLEKNTKEMKIQWDPFLQLPVVKKEASSDLDLKGVAWVNDDLIAIINNNVVKKGDEVDGFSVVDIQEDKVILTDGEKAVELKIRGK